MLADHLSLSTTVVLTPRRSGLSGGTDNTMEILVRVQAADAPGGDAADRAPQAIALVIDRSGSMEGRPLAEARRCAEYVVGKLRPKDAVSLVQFDNRVQRLWPAVPLGDGAPLREAIAAIHSGGNTHLHGGWLEGAETLTDVAGTGLKRVILLSDGQANEGLTDAAAIAAQCADWARRGVTTSTYGLGNSFNEELMVAMARAGGGNHYYGDTAEDLMDPFQQELELLGNLCLRYLRLSATVPDGVEVQMVNDLPSVEGGWRLPDLAWGGGSLGGAASAGTRGRFATTRPVAVGSSNFGGRPEPRRRSSNAGTGRPGATGDVGVGVRQTHGRRARVSAASRAGGGRCAVAHADGGRPWGLGGSGPVARGSESPVRRQRMGGRCAGGDEGDRGESFARADDEGVDVLGVKAAQPAYCEGRRPQILGSRRIDRTSGLPAP
jgi:Mg-chelatase subunit ChlD